MIVDVKPLHRVSKPEVAFAFDWTRQAVEARGWKYEVWSEPPTVEPENVRFLAGYRRDWLFSAALLDAESCYRSRPATRPVMHAAAGGMSRARGSRRIRYAIPLRRRDRRSGRVGGDNRGKRGGPQGRAWLCPAAVFEGAVVLRFPVTLLMIGVGLADKGLFSEGDARRDAALAQTGRRTTRLGVRPFVEQATTLPSEPATALGRTPPVTLRRAVERTGTPIPPRPQSAATTHRARGAALPLRHPTPARPAPARAAPGRRRPGCRRH